LVGQRLAIPALPVEKSAISVVIAVRSDCVFCQKSLPYYRELDRLRKTARRPVSLFFVSSEPKESLRIFLANAGIFPDGIASAEFRDLGIAITPTLAVVGPEGIVTRAYFGTLSDQASGELLALVRDKEPPNVAAH
jgi:hypothetical protein